MKKVTFVALSLLAVVSFTSCGGNGSTEASTPACDSCSTAVDSTKVADSTATPVVETTTVADSAK